MSSTDTPILQMKKERPQKSSDPPVTQLLHGRAETDSGHLPPFIT